MARRTVVALSLAAVLATLAAGCGTVSTSTSSSSSPAAANPSAASSRTTASAASTSPAGNQAGTLPAGFARYAGHGFSFAAPSGMKPAPDGAIGGLPAGASANTLTPGGRSVRRASTQIIEGFNPRLRTDVSLDEVAAGLEASDEAQPTVKNLHTNVSAMTVAGAESVRIVTESYTAPTGDGTRTLFHRTWLMVLPRPGLLIDLVVVDEPQRGGALDAATVLHSFRLGPA
jgi:hypothetical protein